MGINIEKTAFPVAGEELEAFVTDISNGEIILDAGDEIRAFIPLADFTDDKRDVYPGEAVTAFVKYTDEEISSVLMTLFEERLFKSEAELAELASAFPAEAELAKAEMFSELGDFYLAAEEAEKAEAMYRRAIELAEACKGSEAEAEAGRIAGLSYYRLGDMHADQDNWDKAMELYNGGISLMELYDDYQTEFSPYARIGEKYRAEGDIDNAIDYLTQAAGMLINKVNYILNTGGFPDLSYKDYLANIFLDLGNLYIEKQDEETAAENFEFAAGLFKEMSEERGTVRDHYNFCEAEFRAGELTGNRDRMQNAYEIMAYLSIQAEGLPEIEAEADRMYEILHRE